MSKIVVVTPTIRKDCLDVFKSRWRKHFDFYDCDVIVVWDGEVQRLELNDIDIGTVNENLDVSETELVSQYSDSCRNAGFLYAAANLDFDVLITLDDDVSPYGDSIGDHLKVLNTYVPTTWMNTIHGVDCDYMRGLPYKTRAESKVVASHGVWLKTPDYDGVSQHYRIPKSISDPNYGTPNFYVGPIPKGVYAPFCGMSVAITREALPMLYYAPMGPTEGYHRFGDIWCGVNMLREFWSRNWTLYTGSSTVVHERASNVYKNIASENAGLEINEKYYKTPDSELPAYFADYTRRRQKFQTTIGSYLAA